MKTNREQKGSLIERVPGEEPSRRALLRGSLALGTSLMTGCDSAHPRAGFLGWMERWNEGVQGALFEPGRLAPALERTAETPAGTFPAYYVSERVPLAPAGWTLKVGGMVERPMVLSLADLQRLPRTDLRIEHHCVEGWSAVASWHGVRLRELAALVGASKQADYVEFRSFDSGYWSSWDRPSAFHEQTMLAYGRNGEALPPEYGAPLRLYAAVKLGYKMVKYLTEVNFLPVRTEGYWEVRGYEWYAGV